MQFREKVEPGHEILGWLIFCRMLILDHRRDYNEAQEHSFGLSAHHRLCIVDCQDDGGGGQSRNIYFFSKNMSKNMNQESKFTLLSSMCVPFTPSWPPLIYHCVSPEALSLNDKHGLHFNRFS